MAKPKFPLQWMVLIIVLGLGALVFWPASGTIQSLKSGGWASSLSSPQKFFRFFGRLAAQGPLSGWLGAWFRPSAAGGINSLNSNSLNGPESANHTVGHGPFRTGHGSAGSVSGTGSGSGPGSGDGTPAGSNKSGANGSNAGGNANQTGAGLNSNAAQTTGNSSAATGIYPTAPSANNNVNAGNNNNGSGDASSSDNGSTGSNDQTQSPDNNSGSNSGSNGSPDNNNSGNNPSNGSNNPVGGGSPSGGSAGGYNGPGAGNGAGGNGGFSPCVVGCYPGCIPGCDPECTPPRCSLGIDPNNLPTANPVLSDSDASQNVSVQDQANQRLTQLLASRAALVAPVQQQAQASKYQNIDPANMPDEPSQAQAPADVQAKIQAHQLNLH